MNYQTIDEIYTTNDKIRENLKELLSTLSEEQANFLPEGEKWTVAKIAEHISIVGNGMMRISAKLLNEAKEKGETSDGKATITEDFLQKASAARDQKLEAPQMVLPSGTLTLAESIEKLDENQKNLEEMRPLFESVGCSDFKFPHPAFGPLNANEWLALIGGHEARHTRQIANLLEKIG
jgi:uncharacterized damage-inducible protein DinB